MQKRVRNQNDSNTSSRRGFLKSIGEAGIMGAAGFSFPHLLLSSKADAQTPGFPERPNILILLTDQQRFPRHWPKGWSAANLPHWNRMTQNGITFTRAYCNSAMCSPSRATLFTGLYPAHHQVVDTLTESENYEYNHLPLDMQNMGKMLASAGYHVEYKGKWHLSRGTESYDPKPEDLEAYGFYGWNPPDAGQDGAPDNYGIRHDARFIDDAIEFLSTQRVENTSRQPFALIVSIVNPHDVIGYPKQYLEDFPDIFGIDLGIDVPDTIDEDLSGKPKVQEALLRTTDLFLGKLITPMQKKTYVNFYAYLQQLADQEFSCLMNVVEERGLLNNTVIFQLSDHGEMGLSHGGMRQKAFVTYEEALNVPLIISNPILFPEPVTTNSLAALIDVMPTLATLAKAPHPERWFFRGKDLSPILSDPSAEVQDTVLFTFDDQRAGNEVAGDPMPQPNHIHAIIGKEWKYARYYDPEDAGNVEFEMYHLQNDPKELNNLAGNPDFTAKEEELRQNLSLVTQRRLAPIADTSHVHYWNSLKS